LTGLRNPKARASVPNPGYDEYFRPDDERLQREGMTTFAQLNLASFPPPEPFTDQLRLAVGTYLARFKGLLARPSAIAAAVSRHIDIAYP
jgi:hypothetical protein